MKYKRKLGHKEKREEREERSNIPNTILSIPFTPPRKRRY